MIAGMVGIRRVDPREGKCLEHDGRSTATEEKRAIKIEGNQMKETNSAILPSWADLGGTWICVRRSSGRDV
jgi:hypothetical protein